MILPIADDGRHDACGTVGGRSHHLAARCVFLVHRHCVKAHPVIDRMRRRHVQAAFGQKRVMDALGASAHLQPAGQDTFAFHAPVDAVTHHLPDARHALIKLGSRADRQLVCPFHLGNRLTGRFGHRQHLFGRFERIGHVGAGLCLVPCRVRQFGIGQHKAAAYGIIGF